MPFSRVSIFFLIILALSLSLKIGMKHEQDAAEPMNAGRVLQNMLTEEGYAVSIEKRSWSPIIRAQQSDCRLLIAIRDPSGATLNRIAQLARPVGPLHYVYRGSVSAEPPIVDPMIRTRVVRQLRQFGFDVGHSPLLAVAASPQCDLKLFDWSRLASVP